ncbi:Coenzyme F420 hydrogenase/dehydrogenase, beta subunit C-terminal domain [Erythrobacter sp. LQ02-29]|uniref:Coenzyme F420 hydrogenase/dehydrogenase, beta subunit C-terminal domain n=1 Tax=Erythrobacter sp. LQ02-29 TaxID=2920384 RepID=UPI001F4E6C84|nr:Coenzyme F420 hydrogenase/dehydrogenase, beta subunit C-terminal domain [Erythrobacter sp. LQ02-29]MCP9222073.1 Coenzyme F420 hydrogenase/dehydrogenase, beta subunit C-terminal domain [Erythrobacter sp. LQ02-29]
MTTRAPGYSRPQQTAPLDEQAEKIVRECCPGLKVAGWDEPIFADGSTEPSWGPYRRCLTGFATDPEVRHRGSSGGAISALAIHALKSGLVERVLHVAPDAERPTRNVITVSDTPEDVLAGSGSRYAASSPLERIDDHLADGRPTVFIGKPCDVSALRQLVRMDERVDRVFPIKLSFFCGGLPSHAGADRITRAMGLDPERLVHFRYRGEGWPGLTVARDEQGKSGEMRYEDSWGAHLSKEVQFRCKICPDAVGGTADIACADAWYGGESGYPQFDEADGRSLIMSRTAAGDALLDAVVAADEMDVSPLPAREIDLMQPAQARRKRRVAARVFAARALGRPVPVMDGLQVGKAAAREKIAAQLKEAIGTARRIVMKRA